MNKKDIHILFIGDSITDGKLIARQWLRQTSGLLDLPGTISLNSLISLWLSRAGYG